MFTWIFARGRFAVGLLLITSVWLGWALFGRTVIDLWSGETDGTYANVGQFGDSFGSLNTLFAGIAALGATMAYFKQSEQLKNDKAAAEKQQFENTFFQLLNVLHEVVKSVSCEKQKLVPNEHGVNVLVVLDVHGREALEILVAKCQKKVSHGRRRTFSDENDRKAYENFFNANSAQLSHYFRTLYRLLSFVYLAQIPNANTYAKIVRAQLSDQELILLFYNGLSWMGQKMTDFIYEFSLLKHLPDREGFPEPFERDLYPLRKRSDFSRKPKYLKAFDPSETLDPFSDADEAKNSSMFM